MKIRISGILFILSIFFHLTGYTQSTEQEKKYKLAVGYSLGSTIGTGFSVRYNFSEKFGLQISMKAPQTDADDNLIKTRAGLSAYYHLIRGQSSAFFVYSGVKYLYYQHTYQECNCEHERLYTQMEYTSNYGIGLGIGMELYIKPNITFSVMGGYGFYNSSSGASLAGETALLFYLK